MLHERQSEIESLRSECSWFSKCNGRSIRLVAKIFFGTHRSGQVYSPILGITRSDPQFRTGDFLAMHQPVNIPHRRWKIDRPPRRVLAIRLQAMGDLVITLPYLQQLRHSLAPGSTLDLLTRQEVESIPRSLELFDRVYALGGERDLKRQLFWTALLIPRLILNRYELVLDLQNNIISRIVRQAVQPLAWSQFDRWSPNPAGERTRRTIEAAGLGPCPPQFGFELKNPALGLDLLQACGWEPGQDLLVLNPAGAFPSRNWPLDRYGEFGRIWLDQFPETRFLVLGTADLARKVDRFSQPLGDRLINLAGKTTPAEAFALLQRVQLALSEDSGLMHMAWVSGIPTLALFGSTRSDQARPLGPHSQYLDSTDLPCGSCMQENCRFGDVHCLTRYSAEQVFEKALALLHSV